MQGKIRKEYDTKQLMAEQHRLKKSLNLRQYNDQIFRTIIVLMFLFTTKWIWCFFTKRKEFRKKHEELMDKIEASQKMKVPGGVEANLQMSKDAELAVLHNLQRFENGKKFLENNISLTKLAVHLNTNTRYLSQIIFRHRNKKFPEYINDLKVKYIAERIRNEKILQNYTHDVLVEEAEFSTTRRFVKAFFASTGITLKIFYRGIEKERCKRMIFKVEIYLVLQFFFIRIVFLI